MIEWMLKNDPKNPSLPDHLRPKIEGTNADDLRQKDKELKPEIKKDLASDDEDKNQEEAKMGQPPAPLIQKERQFKEEPDVNQSRILSSRDEPMEGLEGFKQRHMDTLSDDSSNRGNPKVFAMPANFIALNIFDLKTIEQHQNKG